MTLETTKDIKITVDVKNDDTPVKKIKRPEFHMPISKEPLSQKKINVKAKQDIKDAILDNEKSQFIF